MGEHVALGIAIAYALLYWWRWSICLQRYNELAAKVDELLLSTEEAHGEGNG